jgi:hypothetical protein
MRRGYKHIPSYVTRGRWKGHSGQGGVRYRPCWFCSANVYNRIEFRFKSGSTEPEASQVLEESGDSTVGGTYDTHVLQSGSWAGGDAAGVMKLKDAIGVTGDTDGNQWGTDSSAIDTSTGGSDFMTMDGKGQQKTYGVLYKESGMGKYKGHWYCNAHLQSIVRRDAMDDAEIDLDESYRYED